MVLLVGQLSMLYDYELVVRGPAVSANRRDRNVRKCVVKESADEDSVESLRAVTSGSRAHASLQMWPACIQKMF